jgi:hypothetical protein
MHGHALTMTAVGFHFGRPLKSSLPKAMRQMYCLVIPHSVAAGIAIFKLRSFASSLDQGKNGHLL